MRLEIPLLGLSLMLGVLFAGDVYLGLDQGPEVELLELALLPLLKGELSLGLGLFLVQLVTGLRFETQISLRRILDHTVRIGYSEGGVLLLLLTRLHFVQDEVLGTDKSGGSNGIQPRNALGFEVIRGLLGRKGQVTQSPALLLVSAAEVAEVLFLAILIHQGSFFGLEMVLFDALDNVQRKLDFPLELLLEGGIDGLEVLLLKQEFQLLYFELVLLLLLDKRGKVVEVFVLVHYLHQGRPDPLELILDVDQLERNVLAFLRSLLPAKPSQVDELVREGKMVRLEKLFQGLLGGEFLRFALENLKENLHDDFGLFIVFIRFFLGIEGVFDVLPQPLIEAL